MYLMAEATPCHLALLMDSVRAAVKAAFDFLGQLHLAVSNDSSVGAMLDVLEPLLFAG